MLRRMVGRTISALLLCGAGMVSSATDNILRNADFSERTAYGLPLGWEVFLGGATNFTYRSLGEGVSEVSFYGKGSDVYLSQVPVTLKSGGHYRYSAEVMTSGLDGARASLAFWDFGWTKTMRSSLFPQDTHGQWVSVSWEGEVHVNRNNKAYNFALACSGSREKGPTVFRIRNLRLQALDTSSAETAAPLPDKFMRQPEARIVPISHRLAKMPQAGCDLVFYWSGRPACGLAQTRLVASVDGKEFGRAAFDVAGHAVVAFGRQALGEHRLAVKAEGPEGDVLAENDYRIVVVAPLPEGGGGKRLNNFVTELNRVPLANREVKFFRPERSWVWINLGLAKDNPGAEAYLDRFPIPVVHARPHEPRLETMREVGPGWHTLRVSGVTKDVGELRVNAVGTLFGEARYFSDIRCSFIQAYIYSLAFERRFMWGVCNTLNSRRVWKGSDFEKGYYQERGMKLVDSVVFPSNGAERYDREASYARLTGQGWNLNMDIEVDENATGAAFLNHLNTAENFWRMQAERPSQRINVDWCDNMDYCFDNPVNSVSEIAAIVNSGNGTGFITPECYEAAGRTPEDSDYYMNNFIRFVRSAVDFVPAAKGAFNLYMATYFDPGDYNPYSCPATDLKAMYGRMFRQFATNPAFAENQGSSMGGSLRGEEEIRRWGARCLRHYCLEGNTNDLAEAYGFKWTPGYVDNNDFERGLEGWTPVPAKGGAIESETIPGYGRLQVRISPRARKWNFGDTAAVFTAAESGVNRLERKVVGLEPGKYYALMFVEADREDIRAPQGGLIAPSAMTAELAGAEEVKGLYFRHVVQFLKMQAKQTRLNVYRYVFRAKAPEATLVFRDCDRDGKTLKPGTKQALNYIVFRKYYVEDDAEVAEIANLIKGCAELVH